MATRAARVARRKAPARQTGERIAHYTDRQGRRREILKHPTELGCPRMPVGSTPSVAILFGAGATYGCADVRPERTPLGGQLYERLQQAFPDSWGSLPPELASDFEADFESAMHQAWEKHNDDRLRELLIEMGFYFARFKPPLDASCEYSCLARTVIETGLLPKTRFATLNYECVFDYSIGSLVRAGVAHWAPPSDFQGAVIWKLHGACNLVVDLGNTVIGSISMIATQHYVMGPVKPVRPDMLGDHYVNPTARHFPPVMSLFAPGKHNPMAPPAIHKMRQEWGDWARQGDVIIAIGACPLLADEHVWAPTIESNATVWYVGGTERDFNALASKLGDRLEVLGSRFDEALPEISSRLRAISAR
jgi:hypothetical protein